MLLSLSDEDIQKVWEKGVKVDAYDPDVWRKDKCDAWIRRSDYGDQSSHVGYGWQIDHIDPNGGDDISNLQPLQWKNNSDKSDVGIKCNVTSEGNKNIIL